MIHPTTIIEDGALIADGVEIGPFCHIGKDVKIANGCKIASNVILKGDLSLGENVRVFSFSAIGQEGSKILIGHDTHIREFVQIGSQEDENITPKPITIGHNNFIMGYVQILSGVKTGEFCILTNAVRLYENVVCEERVIIGGMSSVEANNRLGTGVMVGGASYVDHDMPPFTLVEGNRAEVRGLNVIGLRRRLENRADIEDIKAIFKKILGETTDKEVASEIAQTYENEYVKRFASFISSSNMK